MRTARKVATIDIWRDIFVCFLDDNCGHYMFQMRFGLFTLKVLVLSPTGAGYVAVHIIWLFGFS